MSRFLNCCLVALLLSPCAHAAAAKPVDNATQGDSLVYFATNSNGIYAYRFHPASGQADPLGMVAEVKQPTWLTVTPDYRFLYAVTDGGSAGTLSSYSIDRRSGNLHLLNRVSASGDGTTFIAIDKTNKILLANNFGSGQIVAHRLNADGSIGERTALIQHTGSGPLSMQKSAHPHQEVIAADNRHVIAPDLGEDRVYTYLLDPVRGTLQPGSPEFITLPPGTGPRHFAFHPNGKFGYLIDELQSAVTVFAYAPETGGLTPLQTITTLPEGYSSTEKSASELWIERRGRYLYAASRADNAIVVYSIDAKKGTLTFVQRVLTQGKWPRGFALDLTERYLFAANEHTDDVVLFRIDPATGKLTPANQVLKVPVPASAVFVPAEK